MSKNYQPFMPSYVILSAGYRPPTSHHRKLKYQNFPLLQAKIHKARINQISSPLLSISQYHRMRVQCPSTNHSLLNIIFVIEAILYLPDCAPMDKILISASQATDYEYKKLLTSYIKPGRNI